jgi:hypothetical protein
LFKFLESKHPVLAVLSPTQVPKSKHPVLAVLSPTAVRAW